MDITWFDILVAAVIVASAGYAAWKGLLRESLSIFAFVLAAYATLVFGPSLRAPLREVFSPDWLGDIAAYAGVFLLVLVPLSFLSFRFSESVQKSPVGPVDRALGFVFGVGRGLVLVALPYIAFTMLVPKAEQPAWIKDAATYPAITKTAEVILSLVPNQNHTVQQAGPKPRRERLVKPAREPRAKPALAERPARSSAPKPQQPKPTRRATTPDPHQKTYGVRERRALDRLVETTAGDDGSGTR